MRKLHAYIDYFWYRIGILAKKYPSSLFGSLYAFHLKSKKKNILYGTKGSDYRCVLDIHIVHHCNLSCAFCSHFSPIADKWFISAEQLERELTIIAPHIKNHVSNVWLLGGEPLLHPDIVQLLYIARKCLQDIPLDITTNGILLGKMGEDFYDALLTNDIGIRLSEYPIKLDYKSLIEEIRGKGIRVILCDFKKSFLVQKMNPAWKEPYNYNYWNCMYGGYVLELINGKLFSCPQVAFWDFLNKRFGTKFKHQEEDYLQIGNIRSWQDIMKFRMKAKKSCRFCNTNKQEWNGWRLSNKDSDEWIG